MRVFTITPLGIERLEKLIAHFEAGRPGGHKSFYFGTWHQNGQVKEGFCGTAGCAAGECLVVFPEHFTIDRHGELRCGSGCMDSGLQSFFECSRPESRHLFYPSEPRFKIRFQDPGRYGGRILTRDCRASSWVKNAKEFVRRAKGAQS